MKNLIKSFIQRFGYAIVSKYQLERADTHVHFRKILEKINVKTIFDVGAATGEFCFRFKQLFPDSIIHAFEPQSDFFSILDQQSNESLIVNNIVLSDNSGELDFFITSGKESSSLIKPNKTGTEWDHYLGISHKSKVVSDTIDQYCNEKSIERINILKLDVQGAELQVLRGAEMLLRKGKIDLIYSEVLFMQFYEGQPLYHDIAIYLNKYNYKLYNLYNCVFTRNSVLTWADAIFVSDRLYAESVKTN